MYHTYILKSLEDGKHYYGSTSNLDKRFKEHNKGQVKSTKSRIPWILHYSEEFKTKKEAIKRENFFKSYSGHKWLKEQSII